MLDVEASLVISFNIQFVVTNIFQTALGRPTDRDVHCCSNALAL